MNRRKPKLTEPVTKKQDTNEKSELKEKQSLKAKKPTRMRVLENKEDGHCDGVLEMVKVNIWKWICAN